MIIFHSKNYKNDKKMECAKLIDKNEAIVDRLKELKVKSGMTAGQIAEKSKLPESTVNRIFSGKTANPTIASVIQMAKAMGGKATDIFDDTLKVDVVSEAPQVVVPQVDAKLYDEMISIYKDLLKIKDTRITTLLWFVGVLTAALITVAILAVVL
jgi:transcriptional regulator with XRE-family HTH domain